MSTKEGNHTEKVKYLEPGLQTLYRCQPTPCYSRNIPDELFLKAESGTTRKT
jgi:hypothetical protein